MVGSVHQVFSRLYYRHMSLLPFHNFNILLLDFKISSNNLFFQYISSNFIKLFLIHISFFIKRSISTQPTLLRLLGLLLFIYSKKTLPRKTFHATFRATFRAKFPSELQYIFMYIDNILFSAEFSGTTGAVMNCLMAECIFDSSRIKRNDLLNYSHYHNEDILCCTEFQHR